MKKCWKSLDKYCLLTIKTTDMYKKSKILEIFCAKVENNKIIDTFFSKTRPEYRDKALKEQYAHLSCYPTVKEVMPKVLEFAKGYYFVVWSFEHEFIKLIINGKFEYNKNVVSVRETYERWFKHQFSPIWLEYTYEAMYGHTKNYVEPDFDDLFIQSLALKRLYESVKRYNYKVYVEIPLKYSKMDVLDR